jgi:hypothetical protein
VPQITSMCLRLLVMQEISKCSGSFDVILYFIFLLFGPDFFFCCRATAFVAWARGTGSEKERERDLEMRCEYATTLTRFSKLAPVSVSYSKRVQWQSSV